MRMSGLSLMLVVVSTTTIAAFLHTDHSEDFLRSTWQRKKNKECMS